MMTTARKHAPTTASRNNDPLSFRIWAPLPSFEGDQKPWKLVAAFNYLLEALDYIDSVNKRGASVVMQSPAECRYYHRKSEAAA